MEKAIVLLSGGLDSAVALWLCKQQRRQIYTLSVTYYRRNPREITAAKALSLRAEAQEHQDILIEFMKDMEDLDIPNENHAKSILDARPKAYMPGKNLVFYALAAHWAERIGANRIIGGHNLEDQEIYPDARPTFFHRLTETVTLGYEAAAKLGLEIELPLAHLSKKEVVRRGMELRVPFELTWSCYGVGDKHCGQCDACLTRLDAFRSLGITDPKEYFAPNLRL
jgi:7-cyano-7-deazaguanine synthase